MPRTSFLTILLPNIGKFQQLAISLLAAHDITSRLYDLATLRWSQWVVLSQANAAASGDIM
jgi:hypothetical protein